MSTQASPRRTPAAPIGYPADREKKFAYCQHCGRVIYRYIETTNSRWFHVGTFTRSCEEERA